MDGLDELTTSIDADAYTRFTQQTLGPSYLEAIERVIRRGVTPENIRYYVQARVGPDRAAYKANGRVTMYAGTALIDQRQLEILQPDRANALARCPPITQAHTEQAINAQMQAHFGQSDFHPATSAHDYTLVVKFVEAAGWAYGPATHRVGTEKAYTVTVQAPAGLRGGSADAYHPTLPIAGCLAFLDVVEAAGKLTAEMTGGI